MESAPVEEVAGGESLVRQVLEESKKLWRIGGPAVIIRLSTFGSFIVTQSYIGHCGETELASYALVLSLVVRLCHGIMVGMGSATETLCGQAFGAKKYRAMGIYLQRSWLVFGAVATLLLPLFVFAPPFFKALGQTHELSDAARPIALMFIPYHYSSVFFISMQMFLQSQLKNFVIALLALPSFFLHMLLSWIAVVKLNWGVAGAAASLNAYGWTMVLGEFIYVGGGWCSLTWTGFSREAFRELLPVLKLSVSSGIMICLQIWNNAAVVFLAGYMKNAKTSLAALSICINISTWALMMMLGLLTATGVRVSNELGKGSAKSAKFAIKVATLNSSIVGCFFLVLFLIIGKRVSYLFTDSEEVAKYVSSMHLLLVLSVLPCIFQTVLSGAAIGAGYQSAVAYVNLVCFYIIGFPLGIILGCKTDLHVKGIWIGTLCGSAVQILILIRMTIKTDWEQQVEIAKARLSRWQVPSSQAEESNDQMI
ncbi:protein DETOXIFICATION 20-like isoform X2 [Zingiber officinale]|uniref:protein DETOXIFICATION 20-like isoform X2 n=1 Tax=Zingiber officinale TaxID=94328 RepID=UPI001C4AB942|nr:protein DETOXIFICATION 20-like isoform X2 [Zingiber officinale]